MAICTLPDNLSIWVPLYMNKVRYWFWVKELQWFKLIVKGTVSSRFISLHRKVWVYMFSVSRSAWIMSRWGYENLKDIHCNENALKAPPCLYFRAMQSSRAGLTIQIWTSNTIVTKTQGDLLTVLCNWGIGYQPILQVSFDGSQVGFIQMYWIWNLFYASNMLIPFHLESHFRQSSCTSWHKSYVSSSGLTSVCPIVDTLSFSILLIAYLERPKHFQPCAKHWEFLFIIFRPL